MLTVDSETLFNAAAAVVATIAVVIFTLNVEWGYSPVSKVLLVTAFLAGVFALTQRTADGQLRLLGYGVVVVSALVLFFETANTFEVGSSLTVVGLLLIAAVLFGARAALGTDDRFVTGRQATVVMGLVAFVAVTVLTIDVATGGLAYELRLQGEVTVSDTGERAGETSIGEVVVTNPTPLPERVDAPRYRACTVGNWTAYRQPPPDGEEPEPVHVDLNVRDSYNEHVTSYGSKSYPVEMYIESERLTRDTVTVERTEDCPAEGTGEPYIAVFEVSPGGPGRPD